MACAVLFYVFLCLVGVVHAAPITDTTNSIASDSFLEAPSFTTRTMWTIISSSVFTLFACIYGAIHPNIPSPEDRPLRVLLQLLGTMIMALIAPELIITWAMRQWFSARRVTRQFEKLGYTNVRLESEEKESVEVPEQLFRWHFPGALARWVKKSVEAHFSKQSEDYTWTQTHSFFVLMGGFMLYVDGKPCLTLRPDYINPRRVAWFVMQLITRAIYHLETTQVEVGTLAFAVLNFLTYAVWWDKPLNVQCPHPGYWKLTESRPEDHINVSDRDEFTRLRILRRVFRPVIELIGWAEIPTSRKLRVPTFDGSIELEDADNMVLRLAGLLIATIFGGIHCMAWFFAFPACKEQALWRMSAIAITCTPWLSILTVLLFNVLDARDACFDAVYALFVMLYITARAVLLVLMFTTLRDLPPDVYKAVSWTSLVPHL
ncbi:uncharacterized protein F5891DRAFT_982517 [Suillus fuscotomentosus]|uniref:Transmembrane protein n=1 Tax=Suillus fuscotomentosus TaxID=1912939 RepID=A0AAD4E1D5_9AGAM|nr:uncharacterized protein F5891DRAFT_982517 [Suillus fuscotomentosus]KAG1897542.1 hypothetical protein F5891DRAFT_982517 [Suillus fuscotomentosus]